MAARRKEPGPTSRRLAVNLRRIRDERNLTTYQLDSDTEALGWRVPANSITRTEVGDRRVDADDLVVLAVALGCTPNALLLPSVSRPGVPSAPVELTPGHSFHPEALWEWASGDRPLSLPADLLDADDQTARFIAENRPHLFYSPELFDADIADDAVRERRMAAFRAMGDRLAITEELHSAVRRAVVGGLTAADVRGLVEIAIRSVRTAVALQAAGVDVKAAAEAAAIDTVRDDGDGDGQG